MKRSKPRAYAQGDLDYLCGVYAVVNAVRYAVAPLRPLRRKDSRRLFCDLIGQLAQTRGLRDSIVEGNGSNDISRLLRVTAGALRNWYRVRLNYHRPFHGRTKISRRILIDTAASHLEKPGTAVLIGFSWHWTVVRKVSRKGFRLIDSAYITQIRFDQIVIGLGSRRVAGKYRVSPSWVYLINASSADSHASGVGDPN
jgi:hypothetical protein